jgi:hypothetical protein
VWLATRLQPVAVAQPQPADSANTF